MQVLTAGSVLLRPSLLAPLLRILHFDPDAVFISIQCVFPPSPSLCILLCLFLFPSDPLQSVYLSSSCFSLPYWWRLYSAPDLFYTFIKSTLMNSLVIPKVTWLIASPKNSFKTDSDCSIPASILLFFLNSNVSKVFKMRDKRADIAEVLWLFIQHFKK